MPNLLFMFKLINTIVLVLLLLPQFSNTALWVNYEINKEIITEEFCVNKEKPDLQCNGKCHLAEQLTESNQTPAEQPTEVNYLPQIPLFYQEIDQPFIAINLKSEKIKHSIDFYNYSPVFKIEHPPCTMLAA